ncbi:metal-sensitive transcriptional regulator [Streptomyces sp. HNM0663]|uniref:Metal-sensitive transcriptional regulator n=1 Tax=Streptomyces chengmaiensis TaxID=3040919 RepID=A0ABT6HWJ8_9ACTN|nr:metal-sensitive transcriptional regulator [Streptomyces chengmaiensis]MDH2392731.1 metal-sensitive transcriptional regulator [Streptomyces chengmaiensis]
MTTTKAAGPPVTEPADSPVQATGHGARTGHAERAEHGDDAAHGDHAVHGYHKQKDEHLKRLRRVEGQIRGLQRMVEEDVYCIDILTQVSASTKALQSFALQLLEEHLRHCVADAALKGGDEIDAKVEEATKAIARLLRT